ncbi:MAG: tyrosine-type recombinase/integrase [Alistipes sp.]|nr:tyrosine-type recombinase/integrase [Alistipes sp.]
MLESFLSYLQVERRYSPLTLRAYEEDLRQFIAFCCADTTDSSEGELTPTFDPTLVEGNDLRAWIVSLSGSQHLSARSINRKISAVKSFFRYLRRVQILHTDPFRAITALKSPHRLPAFVEESRMNQIVHALATPTETFTIERDTLLFLLLYATGIRLSEVVALHRDDLSDGNTLLKVRGKGDKERVVPIITPVAARITHYTALIHRQNICKNENYSLFLTQEGEPLGRTAIYRIIHTLLRGAGVQGKSSPHVLRHTFATHLLNHGVDIRVIQELLGHASLETTQIYTHNSIEKLKEIYQHAHPRALKDKED